LCVFQNMIKLHRPDLCAFLYMRNPLLIGFQNFPDFQASTVKLSRTFSTFSYCLLLNERFSAAIPSEGYGQKMVSSTFLTEEFNIRLLNFELYYDLSPELSGFLFTDDTYRPGSLWSSYWHLSSLDGRCIWRIWSTRSRRQICKHGPTRNNRGSCVFCVRSDVTQQ
jgi:hypothetical protein